MRTVLKPVIAVLVAGLAVLGALAAPAAACGGLVAPNGAVQLLRTTTLAAHVDGVEHYITSFAFASAIRSRSASAENPPNTIVCGAPIRAHASIAIAASGIIGR